MTPDYARRPPPSFRGVPNAPRGGMNGGIRGGRRMQPAGPPRGHPDDYEKPQRPGYYAGNRQFRMDKIRDQPLEKLHSKASDQIEKERQERIRKVRK